jgi:hypothetical protein
MRYSSPVWAGLASLFNGVRRTRTASPLATFAKKRGKRLIRDLAAKSRRVKAANRVFLNFQRGGVLAKLVYSGLIKAPSAPRFQKLKFPLMHAAPSVRRA